MRKITAGRVGAVALCTAAVTALGAPGAGLPAARADSERPNILIVLADDQRADTMEFMPRTSARVFDEGVRFTRAFVTTPLCSPSRASMLTGQYANRHGVRTNVHVLDQPTVFDRLHDAGYFTGMVGKYLNAWSGAPRPEFDYWVGLAQGGASYQNPHLYVQDAYVQEVGYLTEILRDHALEFVSLAAGSGRPFALLFAGFAPHLPASPAPGDEDLYPALPRYRPPSFNEADVSDKPFWLRTKRPISRLGSISIDVKRRRQLQSLNSLDLAVDAILDELQAWDLLEDTVILYLSDNGIFWGEHRLLGKGAVYEEDVRVPFAVRYPALVPHPRVETSLVANIDVAPTLYDLAGLPIPPNTDGMSLRPLLEGSSASWRTELLLEAWAPNLFTAARTDRLVYVENGSDLPEYYDLALDPYQLQNGVLERSNTLSVLALRARLRKLRGE